MNIPALFTRMSSWPNLFTVSLTNLRTSTTLLISAWTATALPPFASMPATTCLALSALLP